MRSRSFRGIEALNRREISSDLTTEGKEMAKSNNDDDDGDEDGADDKIPIQKPNATFSP